MSKKLRYLTLALLATALLVAFAASADAPRRRWWRPSPPPDEPRYRVTLEDRAGRPLRTFSRGGRVFVLGENGDAYVIRIENLGAERVEAVVSVDGRDAVSGDVASFVGQRGYLIPPYGSVRVEGFRQSLDDVATFRFSDPSDSYSSRRGTPENVGIIGVAFFAERRRPVVAEPRWRPAPPERARRPGPPSPRPTDPSGAGQPSAAAPRDAERHAESDGNLGTEYGESRYSPVSTTRFERATPARPTRVVTLRYDDAEGLEARGFDVFRRRRAPVVQREPRAFPYDSELRFAPPP